MNKHDLSALSNDSIQALRTAFGKACFTMAIGFFAVSSFADERAKKMFDRIDTDGNGVVSFDEFKPPRMNRQKPADLNGDGEVSRDEMLEHTQTKGAELLQRAEQQFSRMDLDHDGTVTSEEAREAIFYRLDKDQDGYLTPEELKRPMRRAGPRHGGGFGEGHGED